MLVINNGKTIVSSWGLTLKPGEQKKIYGIVSRKAIKCSSLSFYPDDPDEVSMIRYNYPTRKVIMSSQYCLENKSSDSSNRIIENNNKKELSDRADKWIEIKNSKGDVIGKCLPPDPSIPPPTVEGLPPTTPVLPELPEKPKSVITNQLPRRRGRRPKITLQVTDADLEKARIEALKLDLKLEAEESELQKTEN